MLDTITNVQEISELQNWDEIIISEVIASRKGSIFKLYPSDCIIRYFVQSYPGSFIESQAVTVKIPSAYRISDLARNTSQFRNEIHELAEFFVINVSSFKLLIENLRIKKIKKLKWQVGITNWQTKYFTICKAGSNQTGILATLI